jgi:hypothetical protein
MIATRTLDSSTATHFLNTMSESLDNIDTLVYPVAESLVSEP